MNKEIWKDIPGYNGKYQASTSGRIRRLYCVRQGKFYKLKTPVIVNQFVNKSKNSKYNSIPYKKVHICYNGRVETLSVHILIAKTFLPNPNNLPEVNHIDKDTFNNRVTNLEWCTISYNRRYSSARKVGCYDMNGKLIKIYNAIIDVVTDGFNYNSVRQCCTGNYNYNTHPKGLYTWKFLD